MANLGGKSEHVAGVERWVECAHLIQETAQWPDVSFLAIRQALYDLRTMYTSCTHTYTTCNLQPLYTQIPMFGSDIQLGLEMPWCHEKKWSWFWYWRKSLDIFKTLLNDNSTLINTSITITLALDRTNTFINPELFWLQFSWMSALHYVHFVSSFVREKRLVFMKMELTDIMVHNMIHFIHFISVTASC